MTIISNAQTDAASETTSPGQWVDAHGDYLFNFAVGQIRDPSVAEDLVQETFLAAFKARARFAGNFCDRTWLVGIFRREICGTVHHWHCGVAFRTCSLSIRSSTFCDYCPGDLSRLRAPS